MPLQNTTIFQILEGIPFFEGFTAVELDLLLETGKWSKVGAGERIVTEGEMDLHMYVIIQGQVEVIHEEKVLAVLQSGDIFGEFGLMGTPRMAHVEARTDCLLVAFEAEQLNTLPLELQVRILRRILMVIFARLQKVNQRNWLRLPPKKTTRKESPQPE